MSDAEPPTGAPFQNRPLTIEKSVIRALVNQRDLLAAQRDRWIKECLKARRERDEARAVIGRIVEWTTRYGRELIPKLGYHDTYGDGVRASKGAVRMILGVGDE